MTTANIPNRREEKKERGGPQMWSKLPRVWTLITSVNVPAGCVTFTVASLRIAAVLVEAFVKFGTGFVWRSSSYLAGTLVCAAPSSDEWSPCTAECRPSCTGAIGRRKETDVNEARSVDSKERALPPFPSGLQLSTSMHLVHLPWEKIGPGLNFLCPCVCSFSCWVLFHAVSFCFIINSA